MLSISLEAKIPRIVSAEQISTLAAPLEYIPWDGVTVYFNYDKVLAQKQATLDFVRSLAVRDLSLDSVWLG